MSAKDLQKLVIRLNASEMELLRQAALVEGSDAGQIAVWAKETLLESAASQTKGPKAQNDTPVEALSSRPECGCGATESPDGRCDGTCVLRF